MLQSRRGFLIGASSLLTAAFVSDAQSFIRRTGRPLLASPGQVDKTLYWYDSLEDDYTLALGEWTKEPEPAPTWRELFFSNRIAHRTEEEINEIYDLHHIWPEDYDNPVFDLYWWGLWEVRDNPCAKAYRFLSRIDLGPALASRRGPLLEFHEGDNHPDGNQNWVNARDMLTLSLLQARLIDLGMNIKIVEGRY